MAANFKKEQALALVQQDGNKFQFADEHIGTILTFFKKRSYAAMYSEKINPKVINQGSVTYNMNAGKMTPAKKTAPGQGTFTQADAEAAGKFRQKTVYLSEPYKLDGPFYAADLKQGELTPDAVAIKFAQALNTMHSTAERGFVKYLATINNPRRAQDKVSLEIDSTKLKTRDEVFLAKRAVVLKALEMSEMQNDDYAVDGLSEDDIFLDFSTKLFQILVDERIIVDVAKAVFMDGITTVGKMGTMLVRRNEFIGKDNVYVKYWDSTDNAVKEAIPLGYVATKYTAVAPIKQVAANAGKLDNLSEDKGFYVEQMFATESEDDRTPTYGAVIYPFLYPIVDISTKK